MIASSVAWVSALDSSADSAEREPLTISIVTVCGVGLALSCHRVLGIVLPSSVVATFCRRLCGWGGKRTFFERPGAMICYVFRRRCCRDTLTFLSFGYEVTGDYNISLQFLHVLRLY